MCILPYLLFDTYILTRPLDIIKLDYLLCSNTFFFTISALLFFALTSFTHTCQSYFSGFSAFVSSPQCQSLRWRHNGHDGVSNHQTDDCLLNRSFGRRSKKTSKLRVTGLCVGNSPETGEFPAEMASNAENVPFWWCHHAWDDDITLTKQASKNWVHILYYNLSSTTMVLPYILSRPIQLITTLLHITSCRCDQAKSMS